MNQLVKPGRKLALKQILIAFLLVLLAVVVSYIFAGWFSAKSVFIGGLVAIVPQAFFAYKAFRYAGARSSQLVMKSFYSGAKLKLGLTAILFALAFKLLVIEPVSFLTGFCLVMATPLLTPIFLKL